MNMKSLFGLCALILSGCSTALHTRRDLYHRAYLPQEMGMLYYTGSSASFHYFHKTRFLRRDKHYHDMTIRRSGVYGVAGAVLLLATMFLPMSTPDWYWMSALSLVAVLIGLALFFNTRERKAGQTLRSVGFFALVVLVLIFAVLAILPAIWIW